MTPASRWRLDGLHPHVFVLLQNNDHLNDPWLNDTSEGWVAVHFTKQFILCLFVYAAGDCVLPNNNSNNLDETSAAAVVSGTTRPWPPKACVYAVRAGPILVQNLTRYTSITCYEPKNDRPATTQHSSWSNRRPCPKPTKPTITHLKGSTGRSQSGGRLDSTTGKRRRL